MNLEQIVEQDFQKNGFSAPTITADGKIHRFKKNPSDKNPDAWYVCFVNRVSGRDFLAGAYGDWHERDWVTFCTDISISSDEKHKYFEKARKQFEVEEKTKWEETSKSSEEFWNTYTTEDGMHEYLARKKIAGLFGARLSENNEVLLVPVRDLEGKLWGYQKIFPDGKKLFKPGTKKKGNFHLLGTLNPKDVLFICEGFATGCSIHMATAKPVATAFDSGNLVEVARTLREAYPDIQLIISGDDDFLTEGNPGATKAKEAAEVCLGTLVLPKFKDRHMKPTDFNDLHALEGLSTVCAQLEAVHVKKQYVKCLGFRNDTYFYTSSENLQINALQAHSEEALLKLMPLEFWRSKFSAPKSKTKIDWAKARSFLINECREKGVFARQKIRGHGVWVDGDKVVCHLGDRLYYDNQFHHLHSLESEFFYELDDTLSAIDDKPISVDFLAPFRATITKFNYSTPQQAMFLGGWMALAPICGVLKWRPHLWLTGEPGSGKTTVKDFVDEYLMNAFKRLSVIGATSEAGIRQALRAAAIPLVFDEIEPEGKKGISRVEDCLDLTRQASSEQRGEILKGGADGQTSSYHARYMALFSSVKPRLIAEADKSRFTYIELNRSVHSNGQWDELRGAMKHMTPSFARRLFARTLGMIPILLHNIQMFQRAFVDNGSSQRAGQQYGTLIAGWYSLESDQKISLEDATNYVKSIPLADEGSVSTSRDQEECLDHLLNSFVMWNETRMLVLRMIQGESNQKECLENYGMKILDGDLFLAITNPQVDKLFESSKWGASWKQILRRLDGVKPRYTAKVNKRTTFGLLIPSYYFGSKESGNHATQESLLPL